MGEKRRAHPCSFWLHIRFIVGQKGGTSLFWYILKQHNQGGIQSCPLNLQIAVLLLVQHTENLTASH